MKQIEIKHILSVPEDWRKSYDLFLSRFYGLWRRVLMCHDTSISEDLVSIVRVKWCLIMLW